MADSTSEPRFEHAEAHNVAVVTEVSAVMTVTRINDDRISDIELKLFEEWQETGGFEHLLVLAAEEMFEVYYLYVYELERTIRDESGEHEFMTVPEFELEVTPHYLPARRPFLRIDVNEFKAVQR
jgi:hypothetical protein